MKIICASNMLYAEEAFSLLGDVVLKDGRSLTADDVRDAELLAIRSTTKVNRALLEGSAVKFVGTATIGTDHFDKAYMDAAGIKWCYSPGRPWERQKRPPADRTRTHPDENRIPSCESGNFPPGRRHNPGFHIDRQP